MTRSTTQSRINIRPIHPGEYLREDVLPALGRPKAEIARLLGVSRQTLYDLLNERQPVTASMALRIAKLSGGSARLWLALQQAHDLKVAEAELGDALDAIPTLPSAA
jgi:antitoxin HigA-1